MEGTDLPAAQARTGLLDLVRARGYERRQEPFQLSSGGSSLDYVDLRRALARGEDLELAARAVAGCLAEEGVEFDAIGGMTMGADPIAHAVAMVTRRSWYSVRKSQKGHGRKQRIEGAELGVGVRVVVVEDTVTTGRALLEAVEVVRETGAEVVAACTILDRGMEVRPRVEATGIRFLALLGFADLGIEPISPAPATDPATAG